MKSSLCSSLLLLLAGNAVPVVNGFSAYSRDPYLDNLGSSSSSSTSSSTSSASESQVPFTQTQSVSKDGKISFMVPNYYEQMPMGYRPANTRGRSENVVIGGNGNTFPEQHQQQQSSSRYPGGMPNGNGYPYAQSPFDTGNRGYGYGANSFGSPDVTYGYGRYPYEARGGYRDYGNNYAYNPWLNQQQQDHYDSARYVRYPPRRNINSMGPYDSPYYYRSNDSYNGANAKYYVNRSNGQYDRNPQWWPGNSRSEYMYRQDLNGQTGYTRDRARNNGLNYY